MKNLKYFVGFFYWLSEQLNLRNPTQIGITSGQRFQKRQKEDNPLYFVLIFWYVKIWKLIRTSRIFRFFNIQGMKIVMTSDCTSPLPFHERRWFWFWKGFFYFIFFPVTGPEIDCIITQTDCIWSKEKGLFSETEVTVTCRH